MKKKFSNKWIASKQARKQRKYRANAPLHTRRKMISANFSKELRKKYSKRNFPLRKGDNVKIMKGEFKNKKGKIDKINLKRLRIMVEGIYRTKKDGTKINVYLDSSNLQIQELNLEDKKRKIALERKQESEKKEKLEFKKLPKQTKEEPKGEENVPKTK